MTRTLATCLAALALAALPGRAQDGDEKVLTALAAAWQAAAEKGAPFTVSLRIEREAAAERPGRSPLGGNPMATGGVFAKRPERIIWTCAGGHSEERAPGECPRCGHELDRVSVSLCSGTIVEADGLIATTHFNIGGKPTRILATIPGRAPLAATLLGHHAGADIALLKVDAGDLPAPKRTNLAQVKVGRAIAALGRGPDGEALTFNPGIISAPGRLSGRAIQVDARTNYGNVGGPLIDSDGNLVGITCKVDLKYAATYGQNSGVSFAVTWDQLQSVLPDLKAGRSVAGTGRPFMGVSADPADESGDGARIGDVVPGGGAEKAGLRKGDVILEFDGVPVKNFAELSEHIQRKAVNDPFRVRVLREGEELEVTGTLGERPLANE